MDKIRIMIADASPIWREGLRVVLDKEDDLEVVCMTANGEETLRLVMEQLPDILLIDVALTGPDGIEITREIKKRNLPVIVLIVAHMADERQILDSVRARVDGYLLKSMSPNELIEAIRISRARNTVILEQTVAKFIWTLVIDTAKKSLLSMGTGASELSKSLPHRGDSIGHEISGGKLRARELEVLQLVAKGMNNRQIAAQLDIAERTVQAHLSNAFTKLEVSGRTAAVLHAIDRGWMSLKGS